MVNNVSIFHKNKEFNVQIHAGGLQNSVNRIAIGDVILKDDSGFLINLKDVFLAPEIHRQLFSMSRLFNHNVSLSKNQESIQ